MKTGKNLTPKARKRIINAARIIALSGVAISLIGAFVIIDRSGGSGENSRIAEISALRGSRSTQTAVSQQENDYSDASQVFAESREEYSAVSGGESEITPEQTVKHGWVINEHGYTYVYGNAGFEQFNYRMTALLRYVNSLNSLAAAVPENARMFNIVAPVSSTFVSIPREIYTADEFFNAAQGDFVKAVGARLDGRIANIDVITPIKALYDAGDSVFFRTDRNWTSTAAYAAYAEYCAAAGFNRYSANSFPKNEAGEFLGSFYAATESENMKNCPDDMVCFCPLPSVAAKLTVYSGKTEYSCFVPGKNDVTATDGQMVYFGMRSGRYSVSTGVENGKKLLVIGDSSAYPLVMLLSAHYSLVELIEPGDFDEPFEEYLTNQEFDDILTVCYSTSAVNGDYVPEFNLMTGVTKNE